MIIKVLSRARSREGVTTVGLVMDFPRSSMPYMPCVVTSPEAAKGSGAVMTSVTTIFVLIQAAVICNKWKETD